MLKCVCTFYLKAYLMRLIYFQDFYNKTFSSSRLQTHSGIDMSQDSTESGLNLFLIPSNLNRNKGKKCEQSKDI